MLAGNAPCDLSKLKYPVYTSEKIDGIRCLIKDGVAYSRTLTPIRNKFIQANLGQNRFNGLDGEIVIDSPTNANCMSLTSSGVMSVEGYPLFTYYVFDVWDRAVKFSEVQNAILGKIGYRSIFIQPLEQRLCKDQFDVLAHEKEAVYSGYEGLIIRDPNGPYKFGRSTLKEGYLLKLKRFFQEEAVVIGYEPLRHNGNNPKLDALGYTKRSSCYGGKVDLPMLGAVVVAGKGSEFNIGTGFTDKERKALWKNRESLIGKIVSYKFFSIGAKGRPRHPIFVAFRDSDDM
jgi:DNA ligase-1